MERFNIVDWIKDDWRRGRQRPMRKRLKLALLFLLIGVGIIFAFLVGIEVVRAFTQ